MAGLIHLPLMTFLRGSTSYLGQLTSAVSEAAILFLEVFNFYHWDSRVASQGFYRLRPLYLVKQCDGFWQKTAKKIGNFGKCAKLEEWMTPCLGLIKTRARVAFYSFKTSYQGEISFLAGQTIKTIPAYR